MVNLEHVQQDGPGKCGVACLEMIFKYYKIPYDKDDIWECIRDPRPGNLGEFAYTHSLAEYAIFHGLNATAYSADVDTCFSVLDRLERLNMPAILSVRYNDNDLGRYNDDDLGHFIAYKGKENGYYLFNDPDLQQAPVKYSPHKIREQWAPIGDEVAGYEYVVFKCDTLPQTCMKCGWEYPLLVHYKIPFLNKVPFSNMTICPYCNKRNFDIWNLG